MTGLAPLFFNAAAEAERLSALTHGLATEPLLAAVAAAVPPGRLAVVSSFGTDSAVLLHLVARVAPHLPVILVDTGRLFGETLRYRDRLSARLGLTDVRTATPPPAEVAAEDPANALWRTAPDACCALRKVRPLEAALAGFDVWISGRKRFQAATRAGLALVEAVDGKVKVNPLAAWTDADLRAHRAAHDLPPHPLEEDGYRSIGCLPCTDRVAPGEDGRAGRWRGLAKTECGIHRPAAA